MKKLIVVPIAATAMLWFGAVAHAALLWNFSYSGTGVTTSAQLTTNDLSGGSYLVTSISGNRNGVVITGPSTFNAADNLLFPNPPFVDIDGISYVAGGISYNVFSLGGGIVEIPSAGGNSVRVALSVTPAVAVPEPATLALIGLGLSGLALTRCHRAHSQRLRSRLGPRICGPICFADTCPLLADSGCRLMSVDQYAGRTSPQWQPLYRFVAVTYFVFSVAAVIVRVE